ncbi:MAG: hypothetical protein LUP99_04135 [Methanomicrobiales archaeon]|nr:hypothetical protein [Methanomicrobiales archaeon]
MQFPTCKTPVRRDGVRISALFNEFATLKYTGYCKIQLGKDEHILAMKEGSYILAESGDRKGLEAFKKIIDLGNNFASVVLCPLTVKQFQVTLLFNAPFRIIYTEETQPEAEEIKSDVTPSDAPDRTLLEKGKIATAFTRIHPVSFPSAIGRSGKVRSIKITAELGKEDEEKKSVKVTRTGEGGGSRKLDKLTLESIKELKETFKTDAADLLRELHMEHLIQGEEKNSRKKTTVKTDK